MPAFDTFPRPPGQSTIRILPGEDGEGVVLTNQPDREALAEDLQMKGPVGRAMARTIRPSGRGAGAVGASCLLNLFLLFGIVIVAGMLISIWAFDAPVKINRRPVGKTEGTAVVILIGASWIGVVCLMRYLTLRSVLGGASGRFTLTLGEDQWVARGAAGRVLGRCGPGEVERIAVDSRGRVVAELLGGTALLTGRLPASDAQWIRQALSRVLGHPVEADGASVAYPCVPSLTTHPGERLPHRLKGEGWLLGCLGALAFALIWNGFISVFVWHIVADHLRGRPNWFATIFIVPFVLIGLLIIVAIVVGFFGGLTELLVHGRRGKTVLELASHPLVAGESCRAFLRQDGNYLGYSLIVALVCEEHATYRHGTNTSTDTTKVQEIEVLRAEEIDLRPGEPFEREFAIDVPAGAMHSFAAGHNRITWRLEVNGGRSADRNPRGFWARSRKFSCVVQPPPPRETIE